MQDFTKLAVWDKAHVLTLAVYRISQRFPREEQYGLTSQMRRAAASIPANIAEGCGRQGNAELNRFLHIALGSANELQYHLRLAHDLNYIHADAYCTLDTGVTDVRRMLIAFIRTLARKSVGSRE